MLSKNTNIETGNKELLDALLRFRQDIKDLNYKERVKLMEEFKRNFLRSYNFDLAYNRTMERYLGLNKFQKDIKDYLREPLKVREFVEKEYLRGNSEQNIAYVIITDAEKNLRRKLEPDEEQYIRRLVNIMYSSIKNLTEEVLNRLRNKYGIH